jgi:protease-4
MSAEIFAYETPRRRRPFLRGCLIMVLVVAGFFVLLAAISTMDWFSFARGEKVAVLPINGLIIDSEEPIEHFKDFVKDDSVKAIVLRLNTPGGGVGPSQEIYEEVRKVRGKKVIVVSMGAVAASGGYLIACAADKIFANPGTITGSIGVIMKFVNVEDLVGKIGLKGFVVKSGEFKDIGSPIRKMKPEERQLIQSVIDNVHSQFVDSVAEGRKLAREDVLAIADGRIFSGEQAKELGLVDRLGNLEDAVAEAGKMAKIEGEPRVVTPPKKKFSIFELLRDEAERIIYEKLSRTRIRLDYIAQ